MHTSVFSLVVFLLLAGCSMDKGAGALPDSRDSYKPIVTIVTPNDGNVISEGMHGVSVMAFHESGIKYVRIRIGLKDIRHFYSEPYSCLWSVKEGEIAEGNYQICAVAVDNENHDNINCINVTVEY